MISYTDYPEIKSMVTVSVINFNDEHEGKGLSLKNVAYNGYNAFRLVKLSNGFGHDTYVAAIEDYIAVTNTERFNNDIHNMLKPEHILILQETISGHMYAIPFEYFKKSKRSMFSGVYISGDSSLSDMLGHHYPIGVHNRLE